MNSTKKLLSSRREKDNISHLSVIFMVEIKVLKAQGIGCVSSHLMVVVGGEMA